MISRRVVEAAGRGWKGMRLPLEGIQVLDLSRVLAGPICTMVLADLGAEVIKVERPGKGDETRESEINPNLAVCSISGFGRTGPWADAPGYDFVVQALGGLMSITGEPEGVPMKVGVALTDVLTGLYSAVAVLAMLRDKKPPGPAGDSKRSSNSDTPGVRHADLALLDCTLASLVNVGEAFLVTGQRPTRHGNAHPQIVPYECFQTSDGYVVLAVGNDEQFRRFCKAASREDLAQDAKFMTNPSRVVHRAELIAQLKELMTTASTRDWTGRLSAAGVPHAPVLTLDEVFDLPQVRARGMIVETPEGLQVLASPIRFAATQSFAPARPPRLGEHNQAILSELGYPPDVIRQFRESGVI
jgi:formyl-CoA transferase